MASSTAKVIFRIAMVVLVLLLFFYVGRPLYWKISATVHDIRQNKQTVKQVYRRSFWKRRERWDGTTTSRTREPETAGSVRRRVGSCWFH